MLTPVCNGFPVVLVLTTTNNVPSIAPFFRLAISPPAASMSSALTAALKFFQLDDHDTPTENAEVERTRNSVSFSSARKASTTSSVADVVVWFLRENWCAGGGCIADDQYTLAARAATPAHTQQADYELAKLASGQERIPSVSLSSADKDRWERLGRASLNANLMSEAVVGSLPKPMSFEDKMTIRNSVPKSPTLDVISAMRSVCQTWCCVGVVLLCGAATQGWCTVHGVVRLQFTSPTPGISGRMHPRSTKTPPAPPQWCCCGRDMCRLQREEIHI